MVILYCIDAWEGVLMFTLDIICFVWICMKKGSMCKHQSSQDWNDLEVAYASRIKPDDKETFQDCSRIVLRLFQDCSRIVPYPFWTSQHWFLLVRYKVLCWNWRSEDPKDLIEDPEHLLHVPWSIFDSLSPFSPGKAQFISQTVKIAHKIWSCVYITCILSFHYFISFWAIWLYHIQSILRGLSVQLWNYVVDKHFCKVENRQRQK